MSEEVKFTVAIILGIVACAALGVAYNVVRDNSIVQMVSKGADPIAAACALGAISSEKAPCAGLNRSK